jgi:hypothetical protein
MLATLAAFIWPPTYRAEINIENGLVFGRSIESPYAAAAYLESQAARLALRERSGQRIRERDVRAEVVEGGVGQTLAPSYIRLRVRGPSPAEAHRRATILLDILRERHQPKFDATLAGHREYVATLERQIDATREDIAEIDSMLRRLRLNPRVNAPAVLLMQAQLEAKQTQLLQFSRELRDNRIEGSANTRMTTALSPLAPPDRREWPSRTLFGAVGFLAGLCLAVLGVIIQAYASMS